MFEVERPKRRHHLRHEAKNDLRDAEAAARAVLSGEATGVPKSGDGRVEMIRVLRAARRSAVKAKSQAAKTSSAGLASYGPREAARPSARPTDEGTGRRGCPFSPRLRSNRRGSSDQAKLALRSLARRYDALSEEIAGLDMHLDRLVREVAPELISLPAIGTDHAGTLLLVAGDNPERLGSEASFASLCGVSPIEASSGKVVRHRLNLM